MRKSKVIVLMTLVIVISFVLISVINPEQGQANTKRFNMSYVYFGNSSSYLEYVNKTQNSLEVISPSYFDLKSDGSLKITEAFDRNFVKEMHNQNVRVVPFLSNHWDRELGRKALTNRKQLVQELADFIIKYDLDGVNVDIENVTEIDRDNYTDLVKLLRNKLPSDKEVSVAVAANPREFNKGWHGSYDYEELAKYSDYLMIMAYDESYLGSGSGPVASYDFVEKSIKYALKFVPSEKIVLGIPFYGRYWQKNNKGEFVGGGGLHLTKVEELVEKYRGVSHYDKKTESPVASFTIKKTDPKLAIFGKTLEPGDYIIWYENEESIKRKLELVNKYNLKGTGSWSLGQELDSTWGYYSLWLNGRYFNDLQGHWAQEDIITVEGKGLMIGISETEFAPNLGLTRAQAATVMVRALGLKESSTIKNNFNDVPSGHWASTEIRIAKENGLIEGVGNGRFSPEESITREQMASLLNRIINNYEKPQSLGNRNSYIDINSNDWSYIDIITMSEQGIFKGYEDGTFRPKTTITRAQMAALLNRIEPTLIKIN